MLDAAAKLAAEFDFEGLLMLIGVDPGAKIIKKEPLDREITLPQMRADHAVKLTLRGDSGTVVYIIEFLARWASDAPRRMRMYGRAAEMKHLAPVQCLLVILSRKGAPPRIPAVHRFGPEDRHPFEFEVFCPWKIPASEILALGREEMYPFVAVAEHRVEQVIEAKERLRRSGNEGAMRRLAAFCTVYFTQEQILEVFGGEDGMLEELILREQRWYQNVLKRERMGARAEALEQGMERGLVKGEEKGRREANIDALRAFLSSKYPDLAGLPEIDRLDAEAARAALVEAFNAPDAAAIKKAIRRRARR